MTILKSTSKSSKNPERPNTGRRSFIWKAGAGMSAILAAAVPGMTKTRINNDTNLKRKVHRLSKQVGLLEDERAIRSLHDTYENMLDSGKYEEVVNLFADNAEVLFNGGVFKDKNRGIRRLYLGLFSSGSTGRKMETAPGFQRDGEQQQNIVEVSRDQNFARASFTYSIQAGVPMNADSTLVKMARLQGEGIMKWWEGGACEVSYVKDAGEGGWKIKRLVYRVVSRADYKPGRSYAEPVDIPLFSETYPSDPVGPDRLVKQG